ncbi:hypothetical protein BC938DRAFT_478839 [Jimgerdemannia flammicorona]|uniref:Uncharacterized protein n=1 Tax=Jimgerdemannia flammicorona TaxID=994334 RepID=A0A433QM71_9FUNG|nr:hypothetical protein BC938DRAFT_478839 [Jimgerdemannia flammicorona]
MIRKFSGYESTIWPCDVISLPYHGSSTSSSLSLKDFFDETDTCDNMSNNVIFLIIPYWNQPHTEWWPIVDLDMFYIDKMPGSTSHDSITHCQRTWRRLSTTPYETESFTSSGLSECQYRLYVLLCLTTPCGCGRATLLCKARCGVLEVGSVLRSGPLGPIVPCAVKHV